MSDYSDIQAELDDFKNAVYGEEVRDSMISAIKKIHDIAESAAGAPDASSATAGQSPIADGQGGWLWGDVATSGDSVPTNVRQAIFNLLDNNAFANDDTYTADLAVLASWATEVTSISLNRTTLNINGMNPETLIATTTPAGGAVTWSSSDESIATVSGGVVTPTGVNGTCTITASCGGKSASCAVTVSGFAILTGISAVYTQSGTVYDTDTLDSLKEDLVVTASYDDSTTQTVTSYTLSGTLAEGTSTITVAYGGFSDTFTVNVSADTAIYRLRNRTFANDGPVDTGIAPLANGDASFTVMCDADFLEQTNASWALFKTMNSSSPYDGVAMTNVNPNTGRDKILLVWMSSKRDDIAFSHEYVGNVRLVLTHEANSGSMAYYLKVGSDEVISGTLSKAYTAVTTNLAVGGNLSGTQLFNGTINLFEWHNIVKTATEINAFLA